MSEMALIPYADYQAACDKVREKLGGADKIQSGALAEKIGEAIAAGGGGGVELPALTDPAEEADIGAGKDVIGADGTRMVGTAVYRTADDMTVSGNRVTAPAGLYKNNATKNVAAGTLGTPSVAVDKATGVITVTARVEEPGYLPIGLRQNMALQPTKAGETVAPTMEEQTVVEAGTYVTGDIKVAALEEGKFSVQDIGVNKNTGMVSVSATTTQAGYVEKGKSVSGGMQLPTQGAKTVVPTTVEQTVVGAGTYVTGDIKVAAVAEQGGVELPTMTNPATAAELMAGYEMIDQTGQIVVGAFDLADEMDEQDDLLGQVKAALAIKAADPRDLYQRVEWIEPAKDETYPYFVTDVYADNETGVEIVASFPVMQDRVPMGSREDSGNTRFYVVYPLSTSSVYYGFGAGATISCSTKVNTTYRLQTNFLNSRIVGVYEEDGTRKANTTISATLANHSAPISIFGYHSAASGAVTSKREYKLYSARISKGYEVAREYIPCYRKSDGAVGLYERFTGVFTTGESTATFAKGADLEW